MIDVAMMLVLLPGLVFGLTLHEFAHAWVSGLLGDGYPRRCGRVSLNPFRHLSLLGTLAIFVLGFGWGKPVMVNLYNFKHPKRDYLLSSLAGPAANLLIIITCLLVMLVTRRTYRYGPVAALFLSLAHAFLYLVALINAILAVLNLLPVPPLDGSKIWPCLIPGLKPAMKLKTTWLFIAILLVLMWTGSLDRAFEVTTKAVGSILPVSDGQRFDAEYSLGIADMAANKLADAEAHFTTAVSINPYDGRVLYDRAHLRVMQNRWQEGLEDVSRAIELEPLQDPAYYELRAEILDHLGRPDEAWVERRMAATIRGVPSAATSVPATGSAPAATQPTSAGSPEQP